MTYCGIYKITDEQTGKVYIGQSIDIAYRWKDHLKLEDSLDIHQGLQQNVLNFSFQIIELCTPEKLDEREKFWIAYYNSYEDGYNMTPGGKTTIVPYTKRARAVEQYSLEGKYIQTFPSVAEAKRITGIGHIDQCCRNERQLAGNYQWKYACPKENEKKEVLTGLIPKNRIVIQYTMDGEEKQIFNTIADAAKSIGVSSGAISNVLSGKSISAGGYRWAYKGEIVAKRQPKSGVKKQVAQISPETGEIIAIYESFSAAAKSFGKTSVSSIADAVKGRTKTAYGFLWKLIN